jgi:predicted small secreted protein
MKRILIVLIVAVALAACSKDKFESVPTVRVNSFGPKEVIKGQQFRLVATVTDKEGDIRDSSILIVRKVYLRSIENTDTIRQAISGLKFPQNDRLEFQVTFSYGELVDNAILQNYDGEEKNISVGLVVVDNAGHRSNYAESEKILLKKL